MSISSDEINYLVYRYLQENGFAHSAFTFSSESLVTKSSIAQADIPPGALITFLQKGLEYTGIEEHLNEDGSVKEFDGNFSLLSNFVCDALVSKEDRRLRRSSFSQQSATAMKVDGEVGRQYLHSADESESNYHTPAAPRPSVVTMKSQSGTKWLQLTGHQGEVFMCMWNPVSCQLASGSSDGMCRLWGLSTMSQAMWSDCPQGNITTLPTAILPHCSTLGEKLKDVTSVAWSPDGLKLATGCYDGVARIWNSIGELKLMLVEHTGPVFSLKWNKAGNYLLSGSYDHRAIVWETNTGSIVTIYQLHQAPVLDVDWKDNTTFATCSSDTVVHVFDVTPNKSDVAVKEEKVDIDIEASDGGHVSTGADSTDGADAAVVVESVVAAPASTAHADDRSNGATSVQSSALCTFKGHLDEVNAVVWSPGGRLLASCSDDSTAKIWALETTDGVTTGSLKHNLLGHLKEIYTVRWTATGPGSAHQDKSLLLCTASFDGTVKVWNGDTGVNVFNFKRQTQPVYSLSPSPSGEYLATGSLGGYVSIWSLKDGTLSREIRGGGDTFDVSWSNDGSMLCSCFSSGTLNVLDVQSF